MADRLWTPSAERVARAAMTAFRHAAARECGRPLDSYRALHEWSIESPAVFWEFYARHQAPGVSRPTGAVMSDDPMPLTRWFEGATLNYAQALLYPPAAVAPDAPAIIAVDESGSERHLSWRDAAGRGRTDGCSALAGRHRRLAIGSRPSPPTSRRRSSSCWPAPRGASSSPRARRTSASMPPTRVSIRSSRACWLHPIRYCTTVDGSTPRPSSTR